jgi:pimeloyl-ACP methyl ester carboxylesterase
MTGAEVIVIPGAWTRASAFDDVRDALQAGGRDADVVELPSRANRLPQLDRGGLGAIDAVVDERIGRCAKPPVLVGHSLGGLIALRAARRHAVQALVLLMPAPPSGMLPDLLKGSIRRPVHSLQMLGAVLSVTTVGRLGLGPPKGLYSAQSTPEDQARGAAHRADESWLVLIGLAIGSREPVRPLGIPTLVIGGAQDTITPTGVLEPLAEALDAEFAELDVAHAFNEESTFELITDAVLDFLVRNAV